MVKNPTLETVDIGRRRLLTTTATGIAVAGAASLLPTNSAFAAKRDDIRPFKVQVPEEQLVDLRRRLAATRWSDNETVADHSQGAQQRLPRTGGDADVHGTWPRQNESRGRGPQLAQYRSRQIRDMQHPVPSATARRWCSGAGGHNAPFVDQFGHPPRSGFRGLGVRLPTHASRRYFPLTFVRRAIGWLASPNWRVELRRAGRPRGCRE